MNAAIVFLYSKKQQTIFTPTIKVEYITLGYSAYKSMWIQKFFNKLSIVEFIRACILHSNNKTNIIFTKNAKS